MVRVPYLVIIVSSYERCDQSMKAHMINATALDMHLMLPVALHLTERSPLETSQNDMFMVVMRL